MEYRFCMSGLQNWKSESKVDQPRKSTSCLHRLLKIILINMHISFNLDCLDKIVIWNIYLFVLLGGEKKWLI